MAVIIAIPYGASGWTYKHGTGGHSSGFQDPAYDVSSWSVGSAAFGMSGCGPGTLGTPWPANTYNHNSDICVRRRVDQGLSSCTINCAVDDNVTVWVNGVQVFSSEGTVKAAHNITPITLDDSVLNIGAPNYFAFRARDRQAVCAWFDIEINAEVHEVKGGWQVGSLGFG